MTSFRFLPVEWHDSLPSTNTFLLDRVRAAPPTPAGTVIAAREQTAGRGRQQRAWIARSNENLSVSFLWKEAVPGDHVPAMAQAVSVGIARVLVAQGLQPTIKWPNDLLVDGKKIGGILCERLNTGNPLQTVIIVGIGLNINMDQEAAAQIDQPATSLAIEKGYIHGVDDILAALLDSLHSPLTAWAEKGFAGIREAYTDFSVTPGTSLRVRDGAQHVEGVFRGFSDDGALRLETYAGTLKTLYSGDVLL